MRSACRRPASERCAAVDLNSMKPGASQVSSPNSRSGMAAGSSARGMTAAICAPSITTAASSWTATPSKTHGAVTA